MFAESSHGPAVANRRNGHASETIDIQAAVARLPDALTHRFAGYIVTREVSAHYRRITLRGGIHVAAFQGACPAIQKFVNAGGIRLGRKRGTFHYRTRGRRRGSCYRDRLHAAIRMPPQIAKRAPRQP